VVVVVMIIMMMMMMMMILSAGSPFAIPVIDGRKATVSGECLGEVTVANKPCYFDISTRMVNGDGPIFVAITCKIFSLRC